MVAQNTLNFSGTQSINQTPNISSTLNRFNMQTSQMPSQPSSLMQPSQMLPLNQMTSSMNANNPNQSNYRQNMQNFIPQSSGSYTLPQAPGHYVSSAWNQNIYNPSYFRPTATPNRFMQGSLSHGQMINPYASNILITNINPFGSYVASQNMPYAGKPSFQTTQKLSAPMLYYSPIIT